MSSLLCKTKLLNIIVKPITTQCCLPIPTVNIRKPLGFLFVSSGRDKLHYDVIR